MHANWYVKSWVPFVRCMWFSVELQAPRYTSKFKTACHGCKTKLLNLHGLDKNFFFSDQFCESVKVEVQIHTGAVFCKMKYLSLVILLSLDCLSFSAYLSFSYFCSGADTVFLMLMDRTQAFQKSVLLLPAALGFLNCTTLWLYFLMGTIQVQSCMDMKFIMKSFDCPINMYSSTELVSEQKFSSSQLLLKQRTRYVLQLCCYMSLVSLSEMDCPGTLSKSYV